MAEMPSKPRASDSPDFNQCDSCILYALCLRYNRMVLALAVRHSLSSCPCGLLSVARNGRLSIYSDHFHSTSLSLALEFLFGDSSHFLSLP